MDKSVEKTYLAATTLVYENVTRDCVGVAMWRLIHAATVDGLK